MEMREMGPRASVRHAGLLDLTHRLGLVFMVRTRWCYMQILPMGR
ncbi:MAG: hypothetical protein ABSB22_02585 [Thermodesulfobacteriota bacterium]|jgi:hypothetical protein